MRSTLGLVAAVTFVLGPALASVPRGSRCRPPTPSRARGRSPSACRHGRSRRPTLAPGRSRRSPPPGSSASTTTSPSESGPTVGRAAGWTCARSRATGRATSAPTPLASGRSSASSRGAQAGRRRDPSVHQVGGVEEDLLDGLALLTDEPRDPEAAVADLTAALAGSLEVAAAAAPAPPEVLVHLGVGADVERVVGRGAGARPGGPVETGAPEPPETDRDDGGHHRDAEEETEHAARSYPARATATSVCTSMASVRRPPAVNAIVRYGCRLAM